MIPPADLGIWIGLLFRVSGGLEPRLSHEGGACPLEFRSMRPIEFNATVPFNGYESLHGVEGTFGCVQGR